MNARRLLLKNGLFGLFSLAAAKGALASGASKVAEHGDAGKSLEERIQRQEDLQEVHRVMNRYELYLQVARLKEAANTFALKSPGVRSELVWGIWEGEAGIRRLYLGLHDYMLGDQAKGTTKPGAMYILANTHPTIEVAGDGKTAKGLWICPGVSTKAPSKGKDAQAYWGYCKRAADFIKEDGKWKIWHYKVWGLFYTPFNMSWTEANNSAHMDTSWIPAEFKPDRPPGPNWMYSQTAAMEKNPLPPEPYETFADTFSY